MEINAGLRNCLYALQQLHRVSSLRSQQFDKMVLCMGFNFHTQYHLVELLGSKARNPVELLEGIKTVPESCIYFHTHRFLQQHHYLSPEPPNDFAYWISGSLGLNDIGERLASIDTVRYR